MLERVSPVEMRQSLELVSQFKKAGVGFIPLPYVTEAERQALLKLLDKKLDDMAEMAEMDEEGDDAR